jgi:glycosyltransferase involved in cell wall biosynthesis
VRVLLWHGWLLEGSGSNVYTARTAEVLRADGHDVLLLCQEGHAERYPWIDAVGAIDGDGPSELVERASTGSATASGSGRCVLLRPRIGSLLPVFVIDEYEGFDVRRFVDLTTHELETYLERNVEALRAATAWHGSDAVIAGHAIPGGAIARRATGAGGYVVKIHGSDVEYAIRPQARYRELAAEGLRAARTVVGPSLDVLERSDELIGGIAAPTRIVVPGVEVATFRPMDRREALLGAAAALDGDPDTAAGRPASLDDAVAEALAGRDAAELDALTTTYDQRVPDPAAADRLRALAERSEPIVGTFGKLIPQKGVELVLTAARRSRERFDVLVVGFGLHREWLTALALALEHTDVEALAWLRSRGVVPADVTIEELVHTPPVPVTFTGRLDHRYAPGALAAMDVLVVPSILEEAFGMVAAEGAAAGALPLVARHSGLAEVAQALEGELGRPGLCSFEPGPGAVGRVAEGIDRLLGLDPAERAEVRDAAAAFVAREWSWSGTASKLLEAAST